MNDKPDAMQAARRPFGSYAARHFRFSASEDGRVATIALNRPERKNPLTFESYAELRDLFRDLAHASDVRALVLTGAGGNFSSGGDVFEIIEPLTRMKMPELLAFTRMTGDLVKAMRKCPQPVVAAVDGVCAGAGAILAMASDLRLATPEAKTAFLFTRVGLAGADMGACGILPRIIGQGRAAELLFTGRDDERSRRRGLGLLQRALFERGARARSARARPRARRRPMVRARDDQDDAEPGMVDEPRRAHRGGGAGAGDLYGDPRLPARVLSLRRQAQARVRGRLMKTI